MHEHPSNCKLNMKKLITPPMLLLILFITLIHILALLPGTCSQIPRARTPPHPLCNSELALANYACANLPLAPMMMIPPPGPIMEPPVSAPPTDLIVNRPHEEVECCRWLKEVDSECVCDLLVSLPTFLSRPNHVYTLVVNQTCVVSYRCAGRLRP